MKKSRGKPRAKALHQPCKELAEALAMPPRHRRAGYNEHSKPRKETAADYIAAIKAAAHTR